ncbi:TetR/AcrR family transcriptional regulator [Cupriavidus basilensis]
MIPDVIAAAGVSQGSFYNYFRTNDDLLAAVSDALSHDMVQMIESVVGDIEDPALRVATGIRLYLHLARSLSCGGAVSFRYRPEFGRQEEFRVRVPALGYQGRPEDGHV